MKKINLDDPKTIGKIDRSNMLKLLVGFPEQCEKAADIGFKFDIRPSYFSGCSQVVFTGLGGSAIGADLIRSYLADEANVPISVNRNYTLPGFVSKSTLAVASSYSGNTEETISAYKDARAKGARLVAITSGGEIAKMASADNVPLITIPGGLPPRCALGYSFFPSLVLLSKLGIVADKGRDIKKAINLMGRLRDEEIGPQVAEKDNQAKSLARRIHGRYPIIYGGADRIDTVAVRWRGQLAENSKTISSSHVFPEMNHNEIVGWENPEGVLKRFVVICLRDVQDHERIKKRMDITRSIIEKEGVSVIEAESTGDSALERIFSLVYTGDFVSFYLAVLNGVDPTPVDRIAYLKKELAKG